MSENNFFDKLTDTVLDEAAKKACDNPDIEDAFDCEEIEFSPEHEKKMQKILKSANKGSFSSWLNRYGKRVACIALVFLVASFAAVLSVDAWRMRLFWFVIDEGEPNTDFTFYGNITNRYADDNISLGYVPDGMELISSEKTRRSYFICFADNDDYFNLNIGTLSSVLSIDTENGYSENIYIRDNIEATFVCTPRVNTLLWAEDESSYIITSNLSKDEMIRIAENVNR